MLDDYLVYHTHYINITSILQIKRDCMVTIHCIDEDYLTQRELVWIILMFIIVVLYELKYNFSFSGFNIILFVKKLFRPIIHILNSVVDIL